jgi:hypothetical protein
MAGENQTDQVTIRVIDTKLDAFMQSQREVNASVKEAIKEMAKSSALNRALQVELNGQQQSITSLTLKMDKNIEDISEIKSTVKVNEVLLGQIEGLKSAFVKSMLAAAVMFISAISTVLYTQSSPTGEAITLEQIKNIMIKRENS